MSGIVLVFFASPRSLHLGGVQQLPVDSAGVSSADLRQMAIWLGQSPRRWFCVEFPQPQEHAGVRSLPSLRYESSLLVAQGVSP